MEFLNKLNLRPKTIFKIFGLVLGGLLILTLALNIVGASFKSFTQNGFGGISVSQDMTYGNTSIMKYANDYDLGLSTRNVEPMMDESTGSTAENFEVTQYSVSIETGQLEKKCADISILKAKDYVIFENANEYDRGCNYTFKVTKDNKDEVLGIIESLNPKDLTENTQTIKNLIDDFTSEEEILNKKKDTIEATLNDAINSYDEIAKVATLSRDAESLAKIIDSKIGIIEKLSEKRIGINEQLDRLARTKADQLDRLEYVYFYVSIYENKFIDGEQILDSWKQELRNFVADVNKVIQDSSLGLVKGLFYVIQFILYILIFIIAAKYLWKIIKKVWNK